jgi:hypothetical protein
MSKSTTSANFSSSEEATKTPPRVSSKDASFTKNGKEAQGSDVLTLDIGGEKTVKTLRSTLTIAPGSKLAVTFSGRWDDSLPKNELGHFLIDYKPEIFMPLLDFLLSLKSGTIFDSSRDATPPMTPSFDNPLNETAFRRMVDGHDLTSVFYNYEIYLIPDSIYVWSNQSLVTHDCSVLEYPMTTTPQGERQFFSLDRPTLPIGQSHGRKVESFALTVGQAFIGHVGWVRQGIVCCKGLKTFEEQTRRITLNLDTPNKRVHSPICRIHVPLSS